MALAGGGAVVVRADISHGLAVLKELRTFLLPSLEAGALFDPLKAALVGFHTPRAFSLSIPDTAVKASVLEFEELPEGEKDASSLIKWKSAGGVFLKPEECAIDYQVLGGEGKKKVLSVVAKKVLVEGYEEAFLRLGIRVPWINIHSFNVFNLFSERGGLEKNFVFLVVWKDYFSFLAFKDGLLDFYRCKEAEEEKGLFPEVRASFAFYTGRNPDVRLEKVYLLGRGLPDKLKEAMGIDVEPISPDAFFKARGLDLESADPLGVMAAAGALIG